MKRLVLIGIVLLLLVSGLAGARFYVKRVIDQQMQKAVSRVSKKADITYSDVDVDLVGMDLITKDVDITTPQGQALKVGKITIHDIDIKHRKPHHLAATFENVRIPVTRGNFGKHYVDIVDLGYKEIKCDGYVRYAYESSKKRLVIKSCKLDIQHFGYLDVQLDVRNVSLENYRKIDPEAVLIEKLNVAYADRSFIRKIVQLTAKDEQEIVEFLIDGLKEDIERAKKDNNHEGAKTMEALVKFIQTPVSISVNVRLLHPTRIGQILLSKKITDIVKLFAIKVESE